MAPGLLLIDKPQGCTSHDVVQRLRRLLDTTRVGHAGTLDPMATGLLVCGVGQATRVLRYVQDHTKTYEAVMRLGMVTDTQDVTGSVLDRIDGVAIGRRAIELVARGFVGTIAQTPPAYSAVKLGGVPLHRRIRRGMEYAPPPAREVRIEELMVLRVDGPDVAFRVTCSSGTYVRTLCHDWGAALDAGGCMASLRRTRIGPFHVDSAYDLEAMEREGVPPEAVRPLDEAFVDWPRRVCSSAEVERVRQGRRLADPACAPGARLCLTLPSGRMFALATAEPGPEGVLLKASPVFTDVLDAAAEAAT